MTPKLTQQQAIDLVKGVVGKLIDTDALGVKDDYGGQCIALISYYLTSLGYPSVMKMNAIDFYNLCTTTNPLKLQKVSSAQPGDILYINMSFEGKHFSHVSVVIENGGANIVSADANWVNADLNHGSPVAIVVHPASSITAFFRPSFKEEEVMNPDRGSVINMCLEGGHNPTEQEIAKWTSMNWHDAYYDIKKWYPTSIGRDSVINVGLDRGVNFTEAEIAKWQGQSWHTAWYDIKDTYPPKTNPPQATVLQPDHYEVKAL